MFVNEILLIWAEVNYNNICSLQHYKTQRLWNNSLKELIANLFIFENGLEKEF